MDLAPWQTTHDVPEEKPMVQPPRYPDAGDADKGPVREPARPIWVTVLGIVVAVVVVGLIVYAHLAGIVGPGAH